MAYQTLQQEYLQIPVVTRAYTTACVLTTAAVVRKGRLVAAVVARLVRLLPDCFSGELLRFEATCPNLLVWGFSGTFGARVEMAPAAVWQAFYTFVGSQPSGGFGKAGWVCVSNSAFSFLLTAAGNHHTFPALF